MRGLVGRRLGATGRALLAAAFSLMSVGGGVGCGSVTMTAAEARAPVLLGPVGCIGCAPRGQVAAGVAWQAAGVRHRRVGMIPLLDTGRDGGFVFGRELTGAPCTNDFRLSGLRATAWSVTVPILFYLTDLTIDAEVSRVSIANGSCAVSQ